MSSTHAVAVPVRKVRHTFGAIPADWHSQNRVASAISDGVNLLFPAGERFFVRSVKRLEKRIKSKSLLKQVRGFYGQEGSHAREHERYFDILRERGHDIDAFVARFDRVVKLCEAWMPEEINLASTAAAEHFTAIMANFALTTEHLDHAHPAMRDLLRWHAAEEIEHKAVAFDVLQEVDPRLRTRYLGAFIATTFLFGHWFAATAMLLRQNGTSLSEVREDLREARTASSETQTGIVRNVLLDGLFSYLKPDFHPNDIDDAHLAAEYLATRPDLLP